MESSISAYKKKYLLADGAADRKRCSFLHVVAIPGLLHLVQSFLARSGTKVEMTVLFGGALGACTHRDFVDCAGRRLSNNLSRGFDVVAKSYSPGGDFHQLCHGLCRIYAGLPRPYPAGGTDHAFYKCAAFEGAGHKILWTFLTPNSPYTLAWAKEAFAAGDFVDWCADAGKEVDRAECLCCVCLEAPSSNRALAAFGSHGNLTTLVLGQLGAKLVGHGNAEVQMLVLTSREAWCDWAQVPLAGCFRASCQTNRSEHSPSRKTMSSAQAGCSLTVDMRQSMGTQNNVGLTCAGARSTLASARPPFVPLPPDEGSRSIWQKRWRLV